MAVALRVPSSTLLAQTRAVKRELLCGFISQRSIPLDLNIVLSFAVSAAVLGKASVSGKRPDKEKEGPSLKKTWISGRGRKSGAAARAEGSRAQVYWRRGTPAGGTVLGAA